MLATALPRKYVEKGKQKKKKNVEILNATQPQGSYKVLRS